MIGNGCDSLIHAYPAKEAIGARQRRADDADHYHTVANPAKGEKPGERRTGQVNSTGYRPNQKTQQRRQSNKQEYKDGGLLPRSIRRNT